MGFGRDLLFLVLAAEIVFAVFSWAVRDGIEMMLSRGSAEDLKAAVWGAGPLPQGGILNKSFQEIVEELDNSTSLNSTCLLKP